MRPSYVRRINAHFGSQVDLSQDPYDDNVWWVTRVITPARYRVQGHATVLLAEVCAEADRENVTLRLWVEPGDASTDSAGLHRLYSRHGFVGCHLMSRRSKTAEAVPSC